MQKTIKSFYSVRKFFVLLVCYPEQGRYNRLPLSLPVESMEKKFFQSRKSQGIVTFLLENQKKSEILVLPFEKSEKTISEKKKMYYRWQV